MLGRLLSPSCASLLPRRLACGFPFLPIHHDHHDSTRLLLQLPTTTTRHFAFLPHWKRKKERPWKRARNRKRLLREKPYREKLKELAARERAIQKLKQLPPADSITDNNLFKQMQLFEPTASPFVFLAGDDNDDIPPYWDMPSKLHRDRASFRYVASTEFAEKDGGRPQLYPPDGILPEVAFLGRSNVGKSSLMNSLMQAKLAWTSKRPGRTQQSSYYACFSSVHVGDDDWRRASGFFVDLPGYGYARGPDEAVDAWQGRTQKYLLHRMESGHLRRLFVLIDSRQVQQSMDWSILGWLDQAAPDLPYSLVLTKIDGLAKGPAEIVPHLNQISMRYQHKFQQSRDVEEGLDDEEEDEESDYGSGDSGEELSQAHRDYLRTNRVEPSFQIDHSRRGGQSPVIHVTSASKNLGMQELWKCIAFEFGLPHPGPK